MSTFQLELRLDAPAEDPLAGAFSEESGRARAQVYGELGLEARSGGWARIELGRPGSSELLSRLWEVCGTGRVVAGSGTLYEQLEPEESESADWFLVTTPTAPDSFSLWDDYPSYKAGTHPPGHVLNHTFVSLAFVQACAYAGLRGISFLRCIDKGRRRGPAWFAALPDHPLGRGLDHPWFDRARWLRDVSADPHARTSSLHTGQHTFHQRWVREDLGKDATLLRPILDLFADGAAHETKLLGLSFVTVPRYWEPAAPDADFAYVPWGEDGPNREGKMMRFRLLLVSGRARRALIDADLLDAAALLAVRSVSVPEGGVENLDQGGEPIPPMFTPEELAELQAEELRLFGN